MNGRFAFHAVVFGIQSASLPLYLLLSVILFFSPGAFFFKFCLDPVQFFGPCGFVCGGFLCCFLLLPFVCRLHFLAFALKPLYERLQYFLRIELLLDRLWLNGNLLHDRCRPVTLFQGIVKQPVGQCLVAVYDGCQHKNERHHDNDEKDYEENAKSKHPLSGFSLLRIYVLLKCLEYREFVGCSI